MGDYVTLSSAHWRSRARVWRPHSDCKEQTYTGCLTDHQLWFPVDFQEIFYENSVEVAVFFRKNNDLPGRVAKPWYHTDLFTRSTAQLTDIYWGLLTTMSINLGILWDVFYWYTVKYIILHHITTNTQTQPENFQETLLISSRFPGFPGVLDTLLQQGPGDRGASVVQWQSPYRGRTPISYKP